MLAVDKTVCSTEVISNLIDWEFESEQVRILQIFERGNMVLAEIYLDKNISWCNKYIKDIVMPMEFVIVYIYRDSEVIYPKGDLNMVLAEIYLDKNISWCNKYIKDIVMPMEFVIVYIYRDSEVIYPKGDLLLRENDKVVIVTDSINVKSKSQFIYSPLEEALFS